MGCNIVLMKRFLPLFMLTGLLFGQDVLILKSGELTYPFDVTISQPKYKYQGLSPVDKNAWDFEGNSVSQSSTWSWSRSIGFLSEKIPLSFFDYSLLYNIDEHSELYGTLTYYVFGGGIGLGYKYYTMGKSKSSMFVSTCAHRLLLGEFSPEISGFSTAAGVSLRKIGGKTSFNIGISLLYLSSKSYSMEQENEFGILPFINLEKRL